MTRAIYQNEDVQFGIGNVCQRHFIAKCINWVQYCPLTAAWSIASDLHRDSARGRARVTASPSLPYLLSLSFCNKGCQSLTTALLSFMLRAFLRRAQNCRAELWTCCFRRCCRRVTNPPGMEMCPLPLWHLKKQTNKKNQTNTPSATNATDVGISKYKQTFRGCPSCFPPHWSLFLRFPR